MGVSGMASRGQRGLQRTEASVPGAARITAWKRPLDLITPATEDPAGDGFSGVGRRNQIPVK